MKTLKRILHAEDEPDIQAIARLALERVGGFTVLSCENGRVALDAMEKFCPDLLLLDVMMPVMDGPTLLKTLREGGPFADTPAIFLTAKVQAHEIEHYLYLARARCWRNPSSRCNSLWKLKKYGRRSRSMDDAQHPRLTLSWRVQEAFG